MHIIKHPHYYSNLCLWFIAPLCPTKTLQNLSLMCSETSMTTNANVMATLLLCSVKKKTYQKLVNFILLCLFHCHIEAARKLWCVLVLENQWSTMKSGPLTVLEIKWESYVPAWAGYWIRNNTNYNTKITLPAEIHWGLMHNMAPIGKTGLGMLIPPEISLFHLSNYPLKGFKRLVFASGKLNKETSENERTSF